ncbi:hypothetical protein XA68_12224 [Ophiocordyceps unilateralis]|uniref:Uncharacterized protein n=1 Tax=Ophiocordyceps unilateralis TaxID=268505 RepID=A0A2A9PET9_OPHUN|nr:hypothetical protein XA68_12224 [Ophiocordyceps unilateralis]
MQTRQKTSTSSSARTEPEKARIGAVCRLLTSRCPLWELPSALIARCHILSSPLSVLSSSAGRSECLARFPGCLPSLLLDLSSMLLEADVRFVRRN